MAGAGLKPGLAYGTSDEVGRKPAENPVTTYDFHATALYLLGLDHENSLTSLASAREKPSGNLLTYNERLNAVYFDSSA